MPEFHGKTIAQTIREVQEERENGTLTFDPIAVGLRIAERRRAEREAAVLSDKA